MANGKRGDHPLTDLINYGDRTLPDWICDLVLEIYALDPESLFDYRVPTIPFDHEKYLKEHGDWFAWDQGKNLDTARLFLEAKLRKAREREKGQSSGID